MQAIGFALTQFSGAVEVLATIDADFSAFVTAHFPPLVHE